MKCSDFFDFSVFLGKNEAGFVSAIENESLLGTPKFLLLVQQITIRILAFD
jgi:hypothetical protein